MSGDFPKEIQSSSSLVAKHVTLRAWHKLKDITTATTGFTLARACLPAIQLTNQRCGIYAGDWDCYKDFSEVFEAIIQDYHGVSADTRHTSDLNVTKIKGNVNSDVPVISTSIQVGRNIDGFGLSPGVSQEQRLEVEDLVKTSLAQLPGDLAGSYFSLGREVMEDKVRKQLAGDGLFFESCSPSQEAAGMGRDWPEGRGVFCNQEKTFVIWLNQEDHMKVISMERSNNVKKAFSRLVRGVKALAFYMKEESGREFSVSDKHGYITPCPTRLGTGMRASVLLDLPGFTRDQQGAPYYLQNIAGRMGLAVQPRTARGQPYSFTGQYWLE